MANIEQAFETAIEHWRLKGGVGTTLIRPPFNDLVLLLGVLQRFYNKSPTRRTLIIVNDYQDRMNVVNYLTGQPDEDNNKEFRRLIDDKTISVLSRDYYNKLWRPSRTLTVFYHPTEFSDSDKTSLEHSTFKLVLLNKLIPNINILNSCCPLLEDFSQAASDELRTTLPVEETRIPVYFEEDSEDFNTLNQYNEYISTSISIFGSFDNMTMARIGDTISGCSSTQICLRIAQENGWSHNLDMSIGINRNLDELYNPNAIKERANLTYEIIRKRCRLLANNKAKLEVINDIVNENRDKKILIINKFADFANEVTEYLNKSCDKDICGNYHDKVEPIIAKDFNGNIITYKSGAKKGQPKFLAAKAQKSYNESAFNNNVISILSTNSAPDKDLCVSDVDIIIITSPQCESIKTYLYRLSKVTYSNNRIALYSIYCANSTEEKLIEQKEMAKNHRIVNNVEKRIINTNNDDIVIVD